MDHGTPSSRPTYIVGMFKKDKSGEGDGKNIWRNNDWEYPKCDERHVYTCKKFNKLSRFKEIRTRSLSNQIVEIQGILKTASEETYPEQGVLGKISSQFFIRTQRSEGTGTA